MARLQCAALVACAILASGTPQGISRISVRGNHFVDEHMRYRIFHGFNDVGSSKGTGAHAGGSPYRPQFTPLAPVQAQLAEWGFNAMRMPMMWSGVAPLANGTFDDTYVSAVRSTVRQLGSRGIYSLLDMHQDVLSSTLGTYDGAPQWLTNRTDRRRAYPWPLKAKPGGSAWAKGYLTEACGQSFQDLYDNAHGGLDAWGDFWEHVARAFAADREVLGYELINEPWAGDVWRDPALLLPGVAGRRNLAPAYDALHRRIRAVDNDTVIFYEPVTWGYALGGRRGGGGAIGSGFDAVPGGKGFETTSALSYHYYCWVIKRGDGVPSALARIACDDALAPDFFATVADDVARIGGASFLTEFGGGAPNTSKPAASNTDQVRTVLDLADKHLQSWTYWDMCEFYDKATGQWDMDAIPLFVRTYAAATAGTPSEMTFSHDTGAFTLKWQSNATLGAPTEVVAPALLYPNGFSVQASPGVSWARDPSRPNVLLVTAPNGPAVFTLARK